MSEIPPEIPTFTAFPLLQQGHILKGVEGGRSVGMCGIQAVSAVPSRPIRMDDPGLCPKCLLQQAESEFIEEPMDEALARGVERVELGQ